jgi:beta-lactamase regulating signal transducer with metallopeptidase domain
MIFDFDGLARGAWVQFWQVTILGLVIGTIVKLCCRSRPRLAYALWMLVILKSIVPPIWSSPTGLFSWALVETVATRRVVVSEATRGSRASTPASSAPEFTSIAASDSEQSPASVGRIDWFRVRRLLVSIWIAGIVLGSIFVLGKRVACAKLLKRWSLPVDERHVASLEELSRRLSVKREVRLLVTSRPIGPAVFGLLQPSIVLPEPLLSHTPPERVDLILAHELIHVRRGDLLAGNVQVVAQVVWWFHPVVWLANRRACWERERCCDEEVVSGVGCKPALYARTLLSVLEQKVRLRSLVGIPGVRALDVSSRRLESIMRIVRTDQWRPSRFPRLVFAVGLFLVIPGAGLSVAARQPNNNGTGVTVAPAEAKSAVRTLSGVVREKGTGRAVAGAQVSAAAATDQAGRSASTATTDQAGKYTITDLPASRAYTIIALPKPGDAFFITSRKLEATDDDSPLTADVEFVRGIPLRVRVLDRETGKSLKGNLSYYPISPNNPFDRGVVGYTALASKDSAAVGAFYEAGPNDEGQFLGAVLPGPGFLGFSHPYRPGDESRSDRKPALSFPDGKQNIKLTPLEPGGPCASVPSRSEPLGWSMLPLGQYDAVIVVDPREGAEVVTYEIRIASDDRRK